MQHSLELDMIKRLDPKAVAFAVKMYQAISLEPWPQFSQIGPHFLHNRNINPIELWNFKKNFDHAVWDLKTSLGPLDPKRRIKL